MKIRNIVLALAVFAVLFCFAASAQTDNVTKLDIPGGSNLYIEEAWINDGYVLVKAYDSVPKLLLFPLDDADSPVCLEMGSFNGMYRLLGGGTVINADWEGRFVIYDNRLNEVCRQDSRCGIFLGASDEGDVWYLADEGDFALYRDGKLTAAVPAQGAASGSYIGTDGSKAYFDMYDEDYNRISRAVDLENFTLCGGNMLSAQYEVKGGIINYTSEDYWYTAELNNPLLVTVFTKPYSNETVFAADESLLISEKYEYDMVTRMADDRYYVYDMKNGSVCEEKKARDFGAESAALMGYSDGKVLLRVSDENTDKQELFIWNVNTDACLSTAKVYKTLDFNGAAGRVDAIIREIELKYGVKVYYDRKHLEQYATGYTLSACSDINRVGYALIMLKECMAEYPKGLFKEMMGDTCSEIVFCLVDGHTRRDEYSIDDAVGTAGVSGNALCMTLDVNQLMGLRRIFLHENMHLMEFRVENEMLKIADTYYVSYWYKVLDADCPPIQQYIWERTEENMKGVYETDPENAWYIDWYAKCTISEDEARTMENGIYSAGLKYYTSPHIDKKSRFLLGMIREAFPCVKNSESPVFWETRTGIVNLREEFPDFINKDTGK